MQEGKAFLCSRSNSAGCQPSILTSSKEMQQYAGVYLLQNYSTCFGCLSHPSSGVHQTVTAASGTGHSVRATTFLNLTRIRSSLHEDILIGSNKMLRYAGIYLLQNQSTCFGFPSHPSSGVHKTVTAASGTGHSI